MKLSELHPQLRASYRFVPNPPVRSALGRAAVNLALRHMSAPPAPDGVRVEIVRLPGGTPSAHVISPVSGGSGAALLYVHGGGMVIGSVAQDYPLAIRLAERHGITVVLAEYRLAPAHPFPVPLDDCARAWAWLVEHAAERGIGEDRLALGGQSAGGGLAAMLAQRLRDAGGVQPAAQWLFCPMLDDRTAADRSLDRVGHRVWDNRSNRAGWRSLLGVEPGSPRVPDGAVPSRGADMSGLPPAWIGTGTVELFHAEHVDYARRLQAAGVDVTLDEVPGAPHAFESLAPRTRLAEAYVARADAWLTHLLNPTDTKQR